MCECAILIFSTSDLHGDGGGVHGEKYLVSPLLYPLDSVVSPLLYPLDSVEKEILLYL